MSIHQYINTLIDVSCHTYYLSGYWTQFGDLSLFYYDAVCQAWLVDWLCLWVVDWSIISLFCIINETALAIFYCVLFLTIIVSCKRTRSTMNFYTQKNGNKVQYRQLM